MGHKLNSFSARLSRLRRVAGLSQRELDRLAGITEGHSNALERDPRHGVTAAIVTRLAAVFGVTIDWLYCGKGPTPSDSDIMRAVQRTRRRLASGVAGIPRGPVSGPRLPEVAARKDKEFGAA